jgi:hypothetical protein
MDNSLGKSQILLERNEDIIAAIVENLQLGRMDDSMQYYQLLQTALVGLAEGLDNCPTGQHFPYDDLEEDFADELIRTDILDKYRSREALGKPEAAPPLPAPCVKCFNDATPAERVNEDELVVLCRTQRGHQGVPHHFSEAEQVEFHSVARLLESKQRQQEVANNQGNGKGLKRWKKWDDDEKYTILVGLAHSRSRNFKSLGELLPDRNQNQIRMVVNKNLKEPSQQALLGKLPQPPPGYVPPPLLREFYTQFISPVVGPREGEVCRDGDGDGDGDGDVRSELAPRQGRDNWGHLVARTTGARAPIRVPASPAAIEREKNAANRNNLVSFDMTKFVQYSKDYNNAVRSSADAGAVTAGAGACDALSPAGAGACDALSPAGAATRRAAPTMTGQMMTSSPSGQQAISSPPAQLLLEGYQSVARCGALGTPPPQHLPQPQHLQLQQAQAPFVRQAPRPPLEASLRVPGVLDNAPPGEDEKEYLARRRAEYYILLDVVMQQMGMPPFSVVSGQPARVTTESMIPVVTGQPATSGAVRQGEKEEAEKQRGEEKAQQQQQQHEKEKDEAREEEGEEEAQVVVPMRRSTGKRAKLKELNQKQVDVAAADAAANKAATRPPPPGKPFKMSTEDDSWKENARAEVCVSRGGGAKAGAGVKRKAAAEAGKSTAITGTKKRGRKRAIPKPPTAQPSPVLPGGIGSDGALMQFGDMADADHSLCGFSFLDSPGGMPMDMGNSLSFGIMNSENSISFLETALANQNKPTETK